MKGRRKSRLDALQILYQLDLNKDSTPNSGLVQFEQYFSQEKVTDEFTQRLVRGVWGELAAIDKALEAAAENWRLSRMAAIDRNILRLGVYELLYCDDIPATVSINEMVELAKQFGSLESAAFVNGILDRIKAGLDRPTKAP